MTTSWYSEFVQMVFHSVSILLMSLSVCAFFCCKHQRKPKDPKFIDENDPHAKTLYNIKTDIAFPKQVFEEKRQNPPMNRTAMSWSSEYENNIPQSLSLSFSPKTLDSKKYLKLRSYGNQGNSQGSESPLPQKIRKQYTTAALAT